MAAPVLAQVNPPLLVWAREESGFGLDAVARKLRVAADRVGAWERGERKPTVRQAQSLAKLYHRPLGVFFLPDVPAVAPLATEYRRLPGVVPGAESPELRLAIRVMSQRREAALNLAEELSTPLPDFRIAAHLADGAPQVGAMLRSLLGVSAQEQLGWRDDWQAWRRWRAAVETSGVLVFQFPKVPLTQARGLSLLERPLPVIGLNSKETAPGARAFTLVHELVHLALSVGREEQAAIAETRSDAAWARVERFAEEAASAALIPEELFRAFVARMSVARDAWDVTLVRSLASKFRVTPLAMATRLRAAGHLTWTGYERWRADWGTFLEQLPSRAGGFASPVDKALGRGGRPFAQLVLEAMDANRITSVRACHLLDLRFHHFDSLRAELRLGAPGAAESGE